MKNIMKSMILWLGFITVPAFADSPAHWVVKDFDTTIHLYGTFHVLPAGTDWQTEKMLADFDSAKFVIFELSPAQFSRNVIAGAMRTRGLFHGEERLSDFLDKETYDKVVAILRKQGVPNEYLDRVRPWLAGEIINRADAKESTYKRKFGVERVLEKRARRNRQQINGLESTEGQLGISAGLKMKDQVKYLTMALEGKGDDKKSLKLDDIKNAWIKGDMDAIDHFNTTELADYPELYKRLLPDRNKNWIKQIHVMMETPAIIFIAVGAGHMPGEEGVVNLIKKAGYDIERVE